MPIDSLNPVAREIPAPSAVPQVSLTKRDRELLTEEGRPPIEVASAEQEAVRWRKRQDLEEKWKRRHSLQNLQRSSSETENDGQSFTLPDEPPQDEQALEIAEQVDRTDAQACEPEEDSTGTLLDARS